MTAPSTHLSMLLAMQGEGSSEDAWSAFAGRYRPLIVTWCVGRGVHTHQAEDIAQEVLLKMFRSLPTFDPARGRFRAWLNTVVFTSIADYFRKIKKIAGSEAIGGDASYEALVQLQQPEATDALVASVDSYVEPVLAQSLEKVQVRVKPSSWTVFEQTVVFGRPVGEVAKELGISSGAAHMAKRHVCDGIRKEYLILSGQDKGS